MTTVNTLGGWADSSNSGLMFRNKIINGNMRIDQRNSGATITPTTSPSQAGYSVDRWRYFITQSSKVSFAQSNVAPTGFTSSLLCTSTSAYSAIASDVFQIGQIIEGFNVADLSWGTSDAKSVTLSFWARSSLTGLIGGAIVNVDGTRSYPFSYSILAANTWEYKQVTIVGDTTGTWAKDNTQGLRLRFNLGSGSAQLGTPGAWAAGDYNGPTGAVSLVGTTGATLYITGVQLEAGSQASPFEQRPIGLELSLCQRYLPAIVATSASNANMMTAYTQAANTFRAVVVFKVPTRVPVTSVTVSSAAHFACSFNGGGQAVSAIAFAGGGSESCTIDCTVGSAALNLPGNIYSNNASAKLLFEGAEL